jgi:DNA-binding FrmR family transcriptional regulator
MDKSFTNRLNRLNGQLQKLQKSIEDETDCSDVIPQFLAVKGALSSAFQEYLKISLKQCAKKDADKMEQLITMIAKN